MSNLFSQFNHTTMILMSISVILLVGFLLTRLTKLAKLPNVTAYIISGVLIGPHVLNIIPQEMVTSMGFMSDMALAFIAFGVGRFFKKEVFAETGFGIITITLLESLLAGVLITLALHFLFGLEWSFCLLLGAIATATAPASTMMTIRQYHARGNFVNILLQVVAFDDAVCLIVFSFVTAFINTKTGTTISVAEIVVPLLYNIGALALGLASGVILSKLMTPTRSKDNRLILTISLLLGIAGLCAAVDISPLLSCMLFGTIYINMTKDKKLYRQIDKFTPPIFSIFFTISGMSLDIGSFGSLGIIGISYFIIRIVGKYFGAFMGCTIAKTNKPVRNYLGLALIPQAGVAIGLAFLGRRILPNDMGDMLFTIILSSSVLYELIGPACAKLALIYSGSIKKDKLMVKEKKSTLPTRGAAIDIMEASETVISDLALKEKKPETMSDMLPAAEHGPLVL